MDPSSVPLDLLREEMIRRAAEEGPRYQWAREDVCGLLYRPGEVSPDLNHCQMKRGHASVKHSTRGYRNDPGGFDWTPPEPDGMEWPDEQEKDHG